MRARKGEHVASSTRSVRRWHPYQPDVTAMRTYTLDLHTHLIEKKSDAEEYWKRVAEVGLDGVAITEHADYEPEKAYEMLLEGKPRGILLVPGMEVDSDAGHMLVYGKDRSIYGVKELYKSKIGFEALIRVAKENCLMLSVAHPWGFSYDSAAYLYGAKKLEDTVKEAGLGVEVYNGMIGYLNSFIYKSGWVKRPVNFCDFLEKNRVARKAGLGRLGRKVKGKINQKTAEVIARCASALELGEFAAFVTAGSDAHSAERIGAGILKIKSEKEKLREASLLDELYNKDRVVWSGPLVRELPGGVYEKVDAPLRRKEVLAGIRYAAARAMGRKTIIRKLKKGKDAISRKISKKSRGEKAPS